MVRGWDVGFTSKASTEADTHRAIARNGEELVVLQPLTLLVDADYPIKEALLHLFANDVFKNRASELPLALFVNEVMENRASPCFEFGELKIRALYSTAVPLCSLTQGPVREPGLFGTQCLGACRIRTSAVNAQELSDELSCP